MSQNTSQPGVYSFFDVGMYFAAETWSIPESEGATRAASPRLILSRIHCEPVCFEHLEKLVSDRSTVLSGVAPQAPAFRSG